MITRHRRLFAVIIAAYAVFVVLVAFWPSHVDQDVQGPIRDFIDWCRAHGMPWMRYRVIEKGTNVLFFVPLGILATLELGRRRWWLAALLGFAVSGAIEFGQLFLPGRTASLLDVIANGAGATIGALGAFVVLSIIESARRRGDSSDPADEPREAAQRPMPQ